MKNWYAVKAKADQAEISIYDEIGCFGVTASKFIADLKAITSPIITLYINSPGGAVFDALAMYNALRQHPATINVKIMGVAASAASMVAMAGDTIEMPENAFLMIHDPVNCVFGNAADLREMADVLDKFSDSIVGIYAARTGLPAEEIKALLAAETWLTAAEAKQKGFCDTVSPLLKVAAVYDPDRLPNAVKIAIIEIDTDEEDGECDTPDPTKPAPAMDKTGSTPRAIAAHILGASAKAGVAAYADAFLRDPSIICAATADAAIAEAAEIVAVCAAAKFPTAAAPLIQARVPLAAIRDRLQSARAAMDASIIIDHHPPANQRQPVSVWDKVLKRQTKE